MKKHLNWKYLGKMLITYLVICLPIAWLEAHYWSDEPKTVGQIVGKGVFMAVFFTVIFGLVFRSGRAATFTKEKQE
jgi:hypothetical protein